ncbi:MAG: uncharacterized protein KVP18_004022 [Porospora cf. gigantea A]|uniref:uncharacterized protein n=1 Tax=Porospora cf. gigantea A TaxID=2853593 RepID=UPI00355969C6|nr:MAG: hypothetical protein KVP18_004022 [Porospora cf. gigantea A]
MTESAQAEADLSSTDSLEKKPAVEDPRRYPRDVPDRLWRVPLPYGPLPSLTIVPPYTTTFEMHFKKRWLGQSILDVFTTEFRAKPRCYYEAAIAAGRITVDDKAVPATFKPRSSAVVRHTAYVLELCSCAGSVCVLKEDDGWIAVSKPSGMPCHPSGRFQKLSVTSILKADTGADYIHPVNRLDRVTTGVVLLAKNPDTARTLSTALSSIRKYYLARVNGSWDRPHQPRSCSPAIREGWFVVTASLSKDQHKPGSPLTVVVDEEGKLAETRISKTLRTYEDGTSLVVARPVTGRTHQIRVHLATQGMPIVNDDLYATNDTSRTEQMEVVASTTVEGRPLSVSATYIAGSGWSKHTAGPRPSCIVDVRTENFERPESVGDPQEEPGCYSDVDGGHFLRYHLEYPVEISLHAYHMSIPSRKRSNDSLNLRTAVTAEIPTWALDISEEEISDVIQTDLESD